jgi:hypothetical protein
MKNSLGVVLVEVGRSLVLKSLKLLPTKCLKQQKWLEIMKNKIVVAT